MKCKTIYCFILLTILMISCSVEKKDTIIDSKNELEFKTLHEQCNAILSRSGDVDSLWLIANKMLVLAKKTGNQGCYGLAYKYMGVVQYKKNDYESALKYYSRAKKSLENQKDYHELSNLYNNIGVVYLLQNQFDKALVEYQQSLNLREKYNDKKEIAMVFLNLGNLYTYTSNLVKADSMYTLAYEHGVKNNNISICINALNNLILTNNTLQHFDQAKKYEKLVLRLEKNYPIPQYKAATYNNLGSLYEELKDYSKSIAYYGKSFEIKERLKDTSGLLKTAINLANVYLLMKNPEKAQYYIDYANKLSETEKSIEMPLAFYLTLSEMYNEKGNVRLAMVNLKKYVSSYETKYNQMMLDKIAEMEAKYDTEKKDSQIELLNQKARITQLRIYQQRMVILFAIALLIVSAIALLFLIKLNKTKRLANKLISQEKELSDKLLLNTLPLKVVRDLKENGTYEPELYPDASVLFADIVDFTKASGILSPVELIKELNDIFTNFDMIFERNHCERIKTAGDAYIGVCGLPEKNIDHLAYLVKAGIEITEYLASRNKCSKYQWEIRVGIHTGVIIGGIVGIKKYIFDIFGDIVNIADRLQKLAEPMKICVSEIVVDKLKGKYNFSSIGNISVKGKGEMAIYFLEKDKESM